MLIHILFACNTETTTKTFNTNPEVTITSHSTSVDVMEGQEELFRASASDSNDGQMIECICTDREGSRSNLSDIGYSISFGMNPKTNM